MVTDLLYVVSTRLPASVVGTSPASTEAERQADHLPRTSRQLRRCVVPNIYFGLTVTGSNFEITFVNNTSSSTTCFSDTNHLAVKVTAKYCISLDFRPSIMEFPTRHLVLCNHSYLSGCSQFKQVGTRSNQLDLVPVHMI